MEFPKMPGGFSEEFLRDFFNMRRPEEFPSPLGPCPKCGDRPVKKKYDADLDRLRRTCPGCGYEWTTPCLDAGKKG